MSNPVSDLVLGFQDLVAQVPDLLRPVIVALAGAVPFIEGEGAAGIGIIGGIHPVVAALAGAVGNLLCVVVIALATARVRVAVTHRAGATPKEQTPRQEKLQRAYHRYGTAGVSLLGPLLVPTQFTTAFLTGTGVPVARVIAWQAAAIALWTTIVTLIITGVLAFAVS